MDGGESKKGASNKVLIGVLCGLLVLIVGLGVGVVVNALNDKKELGNSGIEKNCLQISDDAEAIDCLEEKAFEYRQKDDDCEGALKVYDDVPVNRFDGYLLRYLYNSAYSMSFSCNDSLHNYWEKKYFDLSNQLEARD